MTATDEVFSMTEYETEIKYILTREQYYSLKTSLGNDHKQTEQINYYYDTEDEILRIHDITCRIRQKDESLTGTLKKHGRKDGISIEKNFKVKNLPNQMTIEHIRVRLMGQLITFRTEYVLSEHISLMLDKNIYLGTVDYELEIEYDKNYQEEADKLFKEFLSKLIIDVPQSADCKSERFFKRLHLVESVDIT